MTFQQLRNKEAGLNHVVFSFDQNDSEYIDDYSVEDNLNDIKMTLDSYRFYRPAQVNN